ncbi:ATP-binding protein [Odoribacter laneus]|uniref:ATP-binding protein n=1 Tax=Odoribacter laneus TaxID=626933 RepID=UPI003AB461A6
MSENQNLEYKETWRDEYLKWICGFANADGGKLYIGIDDSGHIVGVDKAKKLSEDIPNKIQDTLGIIADVNLLTDPSTQNEYIEIVVEPYPYPISYRGQYHYRSGSTKQELKGQALNKFIIERTGKRWDGIPVPRLSIADLSGEALRRFCRQAAKSNRVDAEVLNDSVEHLLHDLHLIDDITGLLKRAAILLFHPDPEKYISGAYIKIGFFRTTDDDLAFQDEIHGPLMLQVDRAIDLLTTKYLTYAITYEGFTRQEKPAFPASALRETLLNAIAHKDYADAAPIQVSVYPDHIVFWNAGQLPDNWTLENLLQKHPSRPHNPDIANALFRSGDIETWGRGFRKIIQSTLEQKQLPPQIDYQSGMMLTFYSDTRSQLSAEGLDENSIRVIQYVLQNGSITNTEVKQLLNVSKPTATRILQSLQSKLERIGLTGKGTSYILKGSQRAQGIEQQLSNDLATT